MEFKRTRDLLGEMSIQDKGSKEQEEVRGSFRLPWGSDTCKRKGKKGTLGRKNL